MLVNMIGVEEDVDVVPIRQGSDDAHDPKNRVTMTTLVGALLSSYTSATTPPPPPPSPAASVTAISEGAGTGDELASASEQRWDAA